MPKVIDAIPRLHCIWISRPIFASLITLPIGKHGFPFYTATHILLSTMMLARRVPMYFRAGLRGFASRRKINHPSPAVIERLPEYMEVPEEPSTDPAAYRRNPVTSAHCIDVAAQKISLLDSVVVTPSGAIKHGRYGELDAAAVGIPLEYLALLRPAAEGAAAVRTLREKSKHAGHGTVLVYGASQANGFAACQLASSAGHAVVAVVGGEHSGNEDLMECMKWLIPEPGTAVPEGYALSKKLFQELVSGISRGDEGIAKPSPEEYVEAFKKNFIDYSEAFPDTRPAAVSEEMLEFKYMEKDRENWDKNMAAFLEQYPPGAPPVDQAKLNAFFSAEQYEIFRQKFWHQTTNVISGGDTTFSPPHAVQKQLQSPETLEPQSYPGAGSPFPYSFSILQQFFPEGTEPKKGGPILGAIIAVTPTLKIAAEKVATAKTLRGKGEALQFLTHSQRAAFGAACSVANQARKEGAPILVIGGSLPELPTVNPTDADIKEAMVAMDIDDDGVSRLNYFVQVYRAGDFPFYAEYAIHRASEELAGPRQIIVTK